MERDEAKEVEMEKERKKETFKQVAAKQRTKIKDMKAADIEMQNAGEGGQQDEAPVSVAPSKSEKLTEAALKKIEAPSAKKAKKSAKPAWARTEAQMEEDKEAEIDSLLEFAYELDYEKYMEDYEVRQALSIIKERVNEITKSHDWKEKMAEEWNDANKAEKAKRQAEKIAEGGVAEIKSQVTYGKCYHFAHYRFPACRDCSFEGFQGKFCLPREGREVEGRGEATRVGCLNLRR